MTQQAITTPPPAATGPDWPDCGACGSPLVRSGAHWLDTKTCSSHCSQAPAGRHQPHWENRRPGTQWEHDREAAAQDPYANAVIAVLAVSFPLLHDPVTANSVRHAIYVHVHTGCGISVHVDDVQITRWRLVPAPHSPRRVHVSCGHYNVSDGERERERILNEALDALGALYI